MSLIKYIVLKIPIYGQLINSSKESFGVASRELILTTVFSLLPIWLYPIVVRVGFGQPFWSTLISFITSGEFFIYSAALLGPLIYATTRTYGEESVNPNGEEQHNKRGFPRIKAIQFPYGLGFVLIPILVCCFAAIFFGIMRADAAGMLPVPLDQKMLVVVSCILYMFTLSCVFCVTVYRENLESAAGAFGLDTKELMDEWGEKHGR